MAPTYKQADLWVGLWTPGIYVIHGTGTVVTNQANETEHLLLCSETGPKAQELFPDLDQLAAEAVRRAQKEEKTGPDYGFVVAVEPDGDNPGIGIFQTNTYFTNDNELFVIGKAASRLHAWCQENPSIYVRMQFPVHAGMMRLDTIKIEPKHVVPLLSLLPPTVTIVHGGNV